MSLAFHRHMILGVIKVLVPLAIFISVPLGLSAYFSNSSDVPPTSEEANAFGRLADACHSRLEHLFERAIDSGKTSRVCLCVAGTLLIDVAHDDIVDRVDALTADARIQDGFIDLSLRECAEDLTTDD